MRGGVLYISKRHSKVSKKYLKSYDPKQESKHIIYLTQIVCMVMECIHFYQQIDLNENSSKGCVLEVDLKYAKELRKLHNESSFAQNEIEIKEKLMFSYQ